MLFLSGQINQMYFFGVLNHLLKYSLMSLSCSVIEKLYLKLAAEGKGG